MNKSNNEFGEEITLTGTDNEKLEIHKCSERYVIKLFDGGKVLVMLAEPSEFKKFIKKVLRDAECGT